MKSTKRIILIFKRWFDIGFLAILAILCCPYLEFVIQKLATLLKIVGSNWIIWAVLPIYFIIFLTIGYFLKKLGGFRFKDFDFFYSFTNPPAWYAAIIGTCAYPFLSFHLNKPSYLDCPLSYSIILVTGIFAIGIISRRFWLLLTLLVKHLCRKDHHTQRGGINQSIERFIEWLQKEKPVKDIENDFFDSVIISRRIAKALEQEPIKSISLIGLYGSGKTTVLNLVENVLKAHENKIIVPISAWGYEDRKLISYILENVIKEMSEYTDCLNISFLPLNLQNIFLNNSWGIFDFLKCIFAFESPESLICRISKILKRSNKKLIIFLEDIDRNQDHNIHHQLYSLFNYFNDTENISFVVSYGEGKTTEPLTKITDKIEIVPKLANFAIYDHLIKFRKYCLEKYNDISAPRFGMEWINERMGLFGNYNNDEIRKYLMTNRKFDIANYRTIDCIVELLRYPRQFKRTLAGIWTAWRQLHGEIYFDDLLVLHTIKNSASGLFHFIISNIDLFKIFARSDKDNDNKELYKQVERMLDIDKISNKILYHKLIQFLFPAWKIQDTDQVNRQVDYKLTMLHPQGFGASGVVDYFVRALSEELNKNEISDQAVMQAMLDYNNDKYSEAAFMAKISNSVRFAGLVEYFGNLLSPAKVLSLTSTYFEVIFNSELREKLGDCDLTGRLWRMSLDNSQKAEDYELWLKNQIDTYLFKSLRFVNDIFYYWRTRSRSDAESRQRSPELHRMYIEKVKQLTQQTEQFVEVLKCDAPYFWTLKHVIFMFLKNDEVGKADDQIFSYWQDSLTDSLVKASGKIPVITAIYSVPLVYSPVHKMYDPLVNDDENDTRIRYSWVANFDAAIAKMLFGDDLYKIMQIISILQEDDYKDYKLDEQLNSILDYAVTHSKQWLKENKTVSES